MTPAQRKILKNYALAVLGAGAVGVSLFFGGFDPDTQRPTPITVDGETIEFTWTDDNTGEDLLIYTDKEVYEDGLSGTPVYVAVNNQSGIDQEVSLMGSFVNQRRYVEDVSVLTVATFQSTSTVPGTCRELTGAQLQRQIDGGADPNDYLIDETTATGTTPRIFDVCDKEIVTQTSTSTEWVPLPQTKRDIYEIAIEEGYLDKLGRIQKSVDGYVAENKSIAFPIKAGDTLYYRLNIRYPANDTGNFFLEAVGSEGAYGHLDPWFNASWTYRIQIDVDNTKVPATVTDFPALLDLSDLPSDFHTNVKTDGCDIRIVESDETTETAFELVDYDDTGDTGELWFLGDSISGSVDTTFYVYYGNSGASCYANTATYGRDNVWTDYILVSHDGGATNSTGGGDGTENGGVTSGGVTGKIGDGTYYDGGDSVSWADNTLGEEGSHANFVVTGWIKSATYPATSVNTMWGKVGSGSDIAGFLGVKSNNTVYSGLGATDTSWYANEYSPGTTISDDTWGKITLIATASDIDIFLNNGSSLKNQTASSETWVRNAAEAMYLGYSSRYGSNGRHTGDIDEVKIRTSSGYTTNWLSAEYNNENSPSTFFTIGTQETDAGGAARRIIRTTQY